jgi:hypothetical protein
MPAEIITVLGVFKSRDELTYHRTSTTDFNNSRDILSVRRTIAHGRRR